MLAPFAAVACWLLYLHSVTWYWMGNPQFAAYNLAEPLNAVRILLVLARRFFQLGVADFHWVATAVLILAVFRYGALRERPWRLAGAVVLGYLIFHCVVGGAVLLRYMLPAIALFYVATAAALNFVAPRIRTAALTLFVAGLAVSNWWNPRYRFASYEDNLAVTDFIQLQLTAATWLSEHAPNRTVTTAWPLTDALSTPLLGYVSHPLQVNPVENFQPESWKKVDASRLEVVALYSRSWDRPPGWQDWPPLARLLQKYFNYARQLPREELIQRFHLRSAARWERRGQWMEIFVIW